MSKDIAVQILAKDKSHTPLTGVKLILELMKFNCGVCLMAAGRQAHESEAWH